MVVTKADLTSGGDATDGTVYTTASITPSANKLILLAVTARPDTVDSAEPGKNPRGRDTGLIPPRMGRIVQLD